MQRRHYYEQPYTSESIPLESPYNNSGASPGYHPDQQHGHAHAYSDQHHNPQYAAQEPVDPFSNRFYNPELSSSHSSSESRNHPNQQYPQDGYSQGQNPYPQSHVTTGADNFGHAASGGVAGIAYSVADNRAGENGADSMSHAVHHPPPEAYGHDHYSPNSHPQAYAQSGPYDARPSNSSAQNPFAGGSDDSSRSSMTNYGPGAAGPAAAANAFPREPYQAHPRAVDPQLGVVDPNAIADDGDDGIDYGKPPARMSALSLHSSRSGKNGLAAGAAAGAAGAAAIGSSNRGSGVYEAAGASITGGGGGSRSGRTAAILAEKESSWMKKQSSGKKRWRWAIIIGVVLVILGAIVGGVLGSVLGKKDKESDGNKGPSADEDIAKNGDLGINSQEIKDLMGNKALYKVFPGIDYTPINSQYPDCEHNPPSQNNVTRDIAVLSQLTDTVRLYGTDCNQTQMVVHAIERLELQDDMKVWLGVWQDGNTTTNARQLKQMWEILDEYGDEPFAGLIIANEILFRQEMSITELAKLLGDTRKELADKNLDMPVATSDLGDDLTQALVDQSDYVMANIHPFFAGVPAKDAAKWTYDFWQRKNGPMWKSDKSRNIIAEIGWPSGGGTNCGDGTASNCPGASVAGVEGMNQLLDDWVCSALTNGTNYFWFSAFDEPWKTSFNEEGKEWEDKWGMFDVNRNLKKGVTIPDCGGRTI